MYILLFRLRLTSVQFSYDNFSKTCGGKIQIYCTLLHGKPWRKSRNYLILPNKIEIIALHGFG